MTDNEREGPLFSNIRVFPTKNNTGTIKASGKVVIAGVAEVAFTVRDNGRGPWVGWPGRYSEKVGQDGKKTWFSDVRIVDEQAGEEVSRQILAEFRSGGSPRPARTGSPAQGRARASAEASEPDGVPF